MEMELAFLEGPLETGNELAAEDATKHLDGDKKSGARFYPVGVIGRQPTGRNNAMDMGMESKLLTPGMQHGEEANFRAEVSRIASDFEKSFRTGAEQQIIEDFLVLQSQCCKLRRKCEDHMDVARREKFSLPCGDPEFACRGLTLRAVSIAAAVVGNGGTMPAAGAFIEMAAECGGATERNGQQHFDMLPAEPLAISFDEGSSCAADEIGHLEGRPAHLFLLR